MLVVARTTMSMNVGIRFTVILPPFVSASRSQFRKLKRRFGRMFGWQLHRREWFAHLGANIIGVVHSQLAEQLEVDVAFADRTVWGWNRCVEGLDLAAVVFPAAALF